jgi:hypothetical protein
MAAIDDPGVLKAITTLGEHFQRNVNNPYVRDILLSLDVSDSDWRMIERLTMPRQIDGIQGYGLEELYDGIVAMARFVYTARRAAVPKIGNFVSQGASPMVKMAIKAFPANLLSFSEMVFDLYKRVRSLDEAASSGTMQGRIEELSRVEHYLGK